MLEKKLHQNAFSSRHHPDGRGAYNSPPDLEIPQLVTGQKQERGEWKWTRREKELEV